MVGLHHSHPQTSVPHLVCGTACFFSYSAHQDHARERHFLFAASIGENFLPLRGHEGVHSQREVASMLLADGRARVVDVLFAGLVVHHQLGVLRRRRAQARHCISAAP